MDRQFTRGEIYVADLRNNKNSEQGGFRPVLIVQNNIGNYYSPTVIVASITARIKKPELPTHIQLSTAYGLHYDSMAQLEQLRTLAKQRLGKYIGTLDEVIMKDIDAAIAISVGVSL